MTQTFEQVAYATQQFSNLLANLARYADGFTYSNDFLESPKEGICVALLATQNNFGPIGALKSFTHAVETGNHFGGWLDTQTGKFYFDAVRIFGEGELVGALKFAAANDQLSVFRLSDFTTFNLPHNFPKVDKWVTIGLKVGDGIVEVDGVCRYRAMGGYYVHGRHDVNANILYWREKEVVETPTLTLPYHEDADE